MSIQYLYSYKSKIIRFSKLGFHCNFLKVYLLLENETFSNRSITEFCLNLWHPFKMQHNYGYITMYKYLPITLTKFQKPYMMQEFTTQTLLAGRRWSTSVIILWFLYLENFRCHFGFLGGAVKNLPAIAGDERDASCTPGSVTHWDPLQSSCLENSMDRAAWRASESLVPQLVMTDFACVYYISKE